MTPSPGEKVLVPTSVKAGAFPGEKLVSVTTESGIVSGFAKADAIIQQGNDQFILAEVKNVSPTFLTVKLTGSFFTTTGLADVASSSVRKASG